MRQNTACQNCFIYSMYLIGPAQIRKGSKMISVFVVYNGQRHELQIDPADGAEVRFETIIF
jgi:hypothetical protein